jgi:hypothetical protein
VTIHLFVIYCLVLNGYVCKELEMIPDSYRPITSITDCIMGGFIGGMRFTMDHAEYTIKGFKCKQLNTNYDAALDQPLSGESKR